VQGCHRLPVGLLRAKAGAVSYFPGETAIIPPWTTCRPAPRAG